MEGEFHVDNGVWNDNLLNKSSAEYKKLAESLENQLREGLFDFQTLNYGANDISVKIIDFQ